MYCAPRQESHARYMKNSHEVNPPKPGTHDALKSKSPRKRLRKITFKTRTRASGNYDKEEINIRTLLFLIKIFFFKNSTAYKHLMYM